VEGLGIVFQMLDGRLAWRSSFTSKGSPSSLAEESQGRRVRSQDSLLHLLRRVNGAGTLSQGSLLPCGGGSGRRVSESPSAEQPRLAQLHVCLRIGRKGKRHRPDAITLVRHDHRDRARTQRIQWDGDQ
jgi:hypothetical protein